MERAIHPRWSADGKRLLLRGEKGSEAHIYVMDVDTGFTRAVPGTDSRDGIANWSHDGGWIYFTSDRTGEPQIWKMPVEGGRPTQITRNGGVNPRESSDGLFLYYADRRGRCSIRRVSVNGGEELPVLRGHETMAQLWALWSGHIVYATTDPGDTRVHIDILDLETGDVERAPSSWEDLAIGMTVSSDGRWILVSESEPAASDIMLVEGFR